MYEIKSILKFPSTAGFGSWRKYFPEDAVSHPAKMNLNLLQYLVLNYTNEGDVVLDPMAGTGATGVICALNGRRCIQVELEERFFKWMEQAKENVEKTSLLTKKGKIFNICGDARKLSELLKEHEEEVMCVLFSPPYGDAISKQGGVCGLSEIGISCKTAREYSEDVNNIGNLPIGEIEDILFSPPYSLGHDSGDNASERYKWRLDEQKKHTRAYSEENNIARLPYDVDIILTSPPYSESIQTRTDEENRLRRLAEGGYLNNKECRRPHTIKSLGRRAMFSENAYSDNNENIGNLKHGDIDVVLTSPPYEESMGDKHHSPKGDRIVREKRHYNTYTETKKKDNIGNLNKETYLSAMLTVYKQCYLVLKRGGKMIIVIKDFVRNFKVVRLHDHTIKLCELAGFILKEVLLFKLPQKSFWRILYQKKHGAKVKDLNLLDYEWVLVFEKLV